MPQAFNNPLVTLNGRLGRVRRETLNGRTYLVAPFVSIVPGVLNGSKGGLYYPASEVAANPGVWNSIPITLGHPADPLTNLPESARQPHVLQRVQLGNVYRDHVTENGERAGEAWFDEVLTRERAPAVHNALDKAARGKAVAPVELSTGLYTDNLPAANGSTDPRTGRPYEAVAVNYRPDHLAILEHQKGACSVDDGCGVALNAAPAVGAGSPGTTDDGSAQTVTGRPAPTTQPAPPVAASVAPAKVKAPKPNDPAKAYAEASRPLGAVANSNPEGHNQYTGSAKASEKALAASDAAGGHSMAAQSARGAADAANDLAGGGDHNSHADHKEAAENHREAARLHRRAAKVEESQMNDDGAERHLKAAAMHDKAAKLHSGPTTNSALEECASECDDEECFDDCLDELTGNSGANVSKPTLNRRFFARVLSMFGYVSNAEQQGSPTPADSPATRHLDTGQWLPRSSNKVSDKQLAAAVKQGWDHRSGQEVPPPDDPDGDGMNVGRGSGRHDMDDEETNRAEEAESIPVVRNFGGGGDAQSAAIKVGGTPVAPGTKMIDALPARRVENEDEGGAYDMAGSGAAGDPIHFGPTGNSNPEGHNQYTGGGVSAIPATVERLGGGRLNGRSAAQHGIGIFGRGEAKKLIGKEVDFYHPSNGDKHQGKMVAADDQKHTIQQFGTKEKHTFYHDPTLNAAAPVTNCPKCGGKMTLNDGKMTCNCGYMATNREGPMTLTEKQRREAVGFLTVNCECWKGADRLLSNKEVFTDEHLVKLVKNTKRTKDAELVANAARKGVRIGDGVLTFNSAGEATYNAQVYNAKAEGSNADVGASAGTETEANDSKLHQEDVDPAVEGGPDVGGTMGTGKVPGGTTNARRPAARPTLKSYLDDPSVPDEVKEIVRNGQEALSDQKRQIVEQLVANFAANDPDRTLEVNALMALKLPDLKRKLKALPRGFPQPTFNNVGIQAAPVYGARPEPPTENAADQDPDILPILNSNWAGDPTPDRVAARA